MWEEEEVWKFRWLNGAHVLECTSPPLLHLVQETMFWKFSYNLVVIINRE
jgi:hypothetical protein